MKEFTYVTGTSKQGTAIQTHETQAVLESYESKVTHPNITDSTFFLKVTHYYFQDAI